VNFRKYLKTLDNLKQLSEVNSEIDWNLEAAAVLALIYRMEGAAVLFNNIKGYPPGFRMAGALYSGPRRQPWQRLAIALEFSGDITFPDWMKEFKKRLEHPVRPVIVPDGACKEVILKGEAANIFNFPLPYLHLGDGGRYGGTLPATITRHPYRDWINVGNYRWMAHEGRRLGGDFQPGQHMADMFSIYEEMGKPMPFCIAMGVNPALDIAAAVPLPTGVNEYDIAGGLQMEPLQLVKAETNDLLVPAEAEIVIEGEVRPGERLEEGPFGEYDGFMTTRMPQPVYQINCITHRRNPILPFVPEGFRFNDTGAMSCSILSPVLQWRLEKSGFPDVLFYNIPEASWAWPVVSAPAMTEAEKGRLTASIWSVPHMGWLDKLLLVDDDVDITNTEELLEVIGTRLRPERVYQSKLNKPISFIAAWATEQELQHGLAGALTYDCLSRPGEGKPEKICLENLFSPAVLEWLQDYRQGVFG
jgi:4-hydroxy-3-polyprenylbenzoate decarboxylase